MISVWTTIGEEVRHQEADSADVVNGILVLHTKDPDVDDDTQLVALYAQDRWVRAERRVTDDTAE